MWIRLSVLAVALAGFSCEPPKEQASSGESQTPTNGTVTSSTTNETNSGSGSNPSPSATTANTATISKTTSNPVADPDDEQDDENTNSADPDQPIVVQPVLTPDEAARQARERGLVTFAAPDEMVQTTPPEIKFAAVTNQLPTRLSTETADSFATTSAPVGSGLQAAPVHVFVQGTCKISLEVATVSLDHFIEIGAMLFANAYTFATGGTTKVDINSPIFLSARIALRPKVDNAEACASELSGKKTALGALNFASSLSLEAIPAENITVTSAMAASSQTVSVVLNWENPRAIFLSDQDGIPLEIRTAVFKMTPIANGAWFPKIRLKSQP